MKSLVAIVNGLLLSLVHRHTNCLPVQSDHLHCHQRWDCGARHDDQRHPHLQCFCHFNGIRWQRYCRQVHYQLVWAKHTLYEILNLMWPCLICTYQELLFIHLCHCSVHGCTYIFIKCHMIRPLFIKLLPVSHCRRGLHCCQPSCGPSGALWEQDTGPDPNHRWP